MLFERRNTLAILSAQRRLADGGFAAVIASVHTCANPGCPCRDVMIEGRSKVVPAPVAAEHDTGTGDVGAFGRPMFRAQLDVDTGELKFNEPRGMGASTREAHEWFRSELTPRLIGDIAAWAQSERADRDRVRELWHDADWSDWSPGEHAAWDLAFSGPWNDSYKIGDDWFQVFEWYCVEPSCTCDIVHIFVEHNRDGSREPDVVGMFDVTASEPDVVRGLDADPGRRAQVREVWRLARERHDYQSRFHERIQAMKPVGAWLHEQLKPPELASKAVAKPSVGRNDRCPCGSGRKFKRCCGR